MPKNMASMEEPGKKILGVNEGITKRILSSFAVTASLMIDWELNNGSENVTQKVNLRCFVKWRKSGFIDL